MISPFANKIIGLSVLLYCVIYPGNGRACRLSAGGGEDHRQTSAILTVQRLQLRLAQGREGVVGDLKRARDIRICMRGAQKHVMPGV